MKELRSTESKYFTQIYDVRIRAQTRLGETLVRFPGTPWVEPRWGRFAEHWEGGQPKARTRKVVSKGCRRIPDVGKSFDGNCLPTGLLNNAAWNLSSEYRAQAESHTMGLQH